jgi:hypothetical protein
VVVLTVGRGHSATSLPISCTLPSAATKTKRYCLNPAIKTDNPSKSCGVRLSANLSAKRSARNSDSAGKATVVRRRISLKLRATLRGHSGKTALRFWR